MVEIEEDRTQVDKVRAVVKKEQEVTDFETRKVESVAYEAQKDLDAALPQLEAATAALDTLSKISNEFDYCLFPQKLFLIQHPVIAQLLKYFTNVPSSRFSRNCALANVLDQLFIFHILIYVPYFLFLLFR